MIICKKCAEKNPSENVNCSKCGADLLPGSTFSDRISTLVISFIAGGIAAFIAVKLSASMELEGTSDVCLLANPSAWFFAAIASPITGIATALRKTPLHERYEKRAIRHKETEPKQALADYTRALEHAPDKAKANILKERSAIYAKLGREEKAIEDRLAYTYADGAYKGGADFAHVFGADQDAYISTAAEQDRKHMLKTGEIKAVGYCKACGHVVELNEKARCPEHPKSKPRDVKFVMPKDIAQAISELEQGAAAGKKLSKKKKTILYIVIGTLVLICVIIPLLVSLLSK